MLEALVKSGACDTLVPAGVPLAVGPRAGCSPPIDSAIEHGGRTQRDREQGQADLFGGGDGDGGLTLIRLPDAPPWTEMELLGHEKDALGLYLSGHPLDRYADALRAFGARTVGDLVLAELPRVGRRAPGRMLLEDVHVGGIVCGLPAAQDQEGRPHGRLHARRRARGGRSRGVSRRPMRGSRS